MWGFFGVVSECGPEFRGEVVADPAFEFGDAAGHGESLGDGFEFRLLAGQAYGLVQTVGASMAPPFFLLVAQTAAGSLCRVTPLFPRPIRLSSTKSRNIQTGASGW